MQRLLARKIFLSGEARRAVCSRSTTQAMSNNARMKNILESSALSERSVVSPRCIKLIHLVVTSRAHLNDELPIYRWICAEVTQGRMEDALTLNGDEGRGVAAISLGEVLSNL